MSKYVVLLKYTEKGIADISESADRAETFRAAAAKTGVTVENQFWTIGPYDGVLILNAPDETAAAAVVLELAKNGNVSTCMLRAFDADQFKAVISKMT